MSAAGGGSGGACWAGGVFLSACVLPLALPRPPAPSPRHGRDSVPPASLCLLHQRLTPVSPGGSRVPARVLLTPASCLASSPALGDLQSPGAVEPQDPTWVSAENPAAGGNGKGFFLEKWVTLDWPAWEGQGAAWGLGV